jgi:hypothetical protein
MVDTLAAPPPLIFPHARRYRTAPGFDKGTLARTLTGLCGQVASLPDRRQAYGSSPLVKSLHCPGHARVALRALNADPAAGTGVHRRPSGNSARTPGNVLY